MSVSGKQVELVGRSTVKEVGDRIEVEWTLSDTPPLEWAEIFQMAVSPDREGPIEWVRGGGPQVMDGTVRWFLPAAELENADREVRQRLAVANSRFGADR